MRLSAASNRVRVVLIALLGATVLAIPFDAIIRAQDIEKKIEKQQDELDRIKKEIEERRTQRKKLGRQEKAVLQRLQNLDREIDLSREFLRNLSTQETLLNEHVDSLHVEIGLHELQLAQQNDQLAARLRSLYMRDPQYRWEVFLGSASIENAVTRYRFLKLIAEQDARLVTGFRERTQTLEVETARLTETLADMAMIRHEREGETTNLEDNKEQRETMLKSIRSQQDEHAKAIKSLEAAQAQVKDLIGALERKRLDADSKGFIGDGTFASLKGKMRWPVEGKVVRVFGKIRHPRYGTVTFSNGIDIKAPSGTPIVTVAAGAVEFVDWIDAYGKCIIVDHGDGYYTLYAHVATTFVSQGQIVAFGEVIAEVGDTGSLDGYVCHFEIRQSKKALDPLQWLSKSRKTGASR